MNKTESKNHINGTHMYITTKTQYGRQIEPVAMSSDSTQYKELKKLLRNYDPRPLTVTRSSNTTDSIHVKIIATRPEGGIQKIYSGRLFFNSERYAKFMEWLHRHETKSWARQAATEDGLSWEGSVPLL